MTDHAVQIVKYSLDRRQYEFDRPALENILMAQNVRDTNISVVSIAGAVRKGKSFMLSFFLRYLYGKYEQCKENWLSDEEATLSGFAWRGGSERHTTGIWVWSKVFTRTLPSGECVGIMLMDTQGIFDNASTMNDNITIFSLTSMLSSTLIYNLIGNVQQDDLQYLQLFIEYGKLSRELSPDFKPFQNLLFLVRDWSFPYELAYGLTGGNQLIEHVLNEHESNVELEIMSVRQSIKSSFDKVEGFLMPYPGRIVTQGEQFSGQLKDIEADFKTQLNQLCDHVLSSTKIESKTIYGQKIKANTFVLYFETYFNAFKNNTNNLPTAQSIINASIDASIKTAKSLAIDHYNGEMTIRLTEGNEFMEDARLMEHHNAVARDSINLFKTKLVFKNVARQQTEIDKLNEHFLALVVLFRGHNESKRNKDLAARQSSLAAQVQSLQDQTNRQRSSISGLSHNLSRIRQQGNTEIRGLRDQVYNLRRQLGV